MVVVVECFWLISGWLFSVSLVVHIFTNNNKNLVFATLGFFFFSFSRRCCWWWWFGLFPRHPLWYGFGCSMYAVLYSLINWHFMTKHGIALHFRGPLFFSSSSISVVYVRKCIRNLMCLSSSIFLPACLSYSFHRVPFPSYYERFSYKRSLC